MAVESWIEAVIGPVFSLFLTFLGLLLCWSYAGRWRMKMKYKRLPPGPFCLPVVGYLPMLNQDKAHITFSKLTKKYGNIIGVYVGSKYMVILNDYQSVKEAFNMEEFLCRPDLFSELFRNQSFATTNGAMWTKNRRFWTSSLRQFGSETKQFENIVLSLASELCSSLSRSEGTDVNVNQELEAVTNNIAFQLLYGKRFEADHPLNRMLGDYFMCTLYHIKKRMAALTFPSLGWLVRLDPRLRWVEDILAKTDRAVREEIAEHRKTFNASTPRDITDLFLTQMEGSSDDTIYSEGALLDTAKVFLLASSESTKTSLVWFMLLMAKYPDVQRRIHEEMDLVLGRMSEPGLSDRHRVPYTEAAFWESMRFQSATAFGSIRTNSVDTTLMGYDIPKDTLIMNNVYAQFSNPVDFPNPDKFDPTRFLDAEGKSVVKLEQFTPFSYGKRNCLGEKTATVVLLLFAMKILQRFEILPPEGGVCLDATIVYGIFPAKPFIRFRKRD